MSLEDRRAVKTDPLISIVGSYLSLEEEVGLLREKAETLRRLARAYETPISPQLMQTATDLEARATALEIRLKFFRAGNPRQSALPSSG